MLERIQLKTADNFSIAGDHYRGQKESPAVLLVHMLPRTKESWASFAEKLYGTGFGVLSIDLRGHGESDGGPEGYKNFSEEETKAGIKDIQAGIRFQKEEGHSPLFVIGSSIGANFSLQALAGDSDIRGAVLLSPGISYYGIETLPAAKKIAEHQSVMVIAARDDERKYGNAADMAQEIFNALSTSQKELRIFDTGGHGNDLFVAHSELESEIIAWVKSRI